MSVTIDPQIHARCWVCGQQASHGLDVRFEPDADGGVVGVFDCHEVFTGYPGFLHGGVVSSLLDGAMTNCLFKRGEVGVTAELRVRFKKPVLIGTAVSVRAWYEDSRRSVHRLGAELIQDDEVKATAMARFMDHPEKE